MQKPVNNQRPELRVRYTPEEFARLKKAFAKTAYNQIGTYARKMTLQEPIEIIQRNASFDSFVEEIGLMRKEMATLRMGGGMSPENQERLLQLHQQIQDRIDKIVSLCMPISG
jgi:hypothetical protein